MTGWLGKQKRFLVAVLLRVNVEIGNSGEFHVFEHGGERTCDATTLWSDNGIRELREPEIFQVFDFTIKTLSTDIMAEDMSNLSLNGRW